MTCIAEPRVSAWPAPPRRPTAPRPHRNRVPVSLRLRLRRAYTATTPTA